MKTIKWKMFFITGFVCLLPIVAGILLWDKLPDTIAIHFDINGNPDGFASKAFAVFFFPFMMFVLQGICCVITDFKAKQYGEKKKFERVVKWIIPVLSILLQGITFIYALGYNVDIRKTVAVIVGVMYILIGNYLPKVDYVKNFKIDSEKARKINRFVGIILVIFGLLFIGTIFLPPISTLICLLLLIPFTAISIIYAIKVTKK